MPASRSPDDPAVPAATSVVPPDDDAISSDWFAARICRNCAAPLDTPFCGQCGQKAAHRLSFGDFGKESWERFRLFEKDAVRTVWKLIRSPGTVARDYVFGKRASQMHPLKLLVVLVAVLVLTLVANRYFVRYDFGSRNADVSRMADRVLAYANWSFTLGIFAIFLGSWVGLRTKRRYNMIEHGVLAIYCQSLILAVIILNLLPTLVWRDPAFVLAHKLAAAYYLYPVKLVIVAVAYVQFFRLSLAKDWIRLAVACLVYVVASWALLRAYAAAILWIVSRTA